MSYDVCVFGELKLTGAKLDAWRKQPVDAGGITVADCVAELDGYGGARGPSFARVTARAGAVRLRAFLEKSEFALLRGRLESLFHAAVAVEGTGELVFVADPRQAESFGRSFTVTRGAAREAWLSEREARALAAHRALKEVLATVEVRLQKSERPKRKVTADSLRQSIRRQLSTAAPGRPREQARLRSIALYRGVLDGSTRVTWQATRRDLTQIIDELEQKKLR